MFYAIEYSKTPYGTYAKKSLRLKGWDSLEKATLALSKVCREHRSLGEVYEYGKQVRCLCKFGVLEDCTAYWHKCLWVTNNKLFYKGVWYDLHCRK